MNHNSPEYIDYMQSPAWDKKRRKRLGIDGYTCQMCQCKDKSLDVHHKTYKRFRRERMSDLESLCRYCHDVKNGKRPYIGFGQCQTCGQFLAMFIRKLKIFGTYWTQYTCQDGHIRSWRDES